MPKITTTLFGDLALITNVAQVPIVETLSFLTDSIEHEDGTEQFIQLRSKARQEFQYDLIVNASNDADAFNTIWGAIRQKWAIPVWAEAQSVGNIADGLSFINCNTSLYDLRDASLAMLFDGCRNFQILEITTVTGSGINLSTVTEHFSNAMLIPVRVGLVKGNVSKPTNGFNGKVSINYAVEDTKVFTPSAPAQYLSNDIYLDTPIPDGEFTEPSIYKRQDIIDFELGKFEQRSTWLISKVSKNFRSVMFSREEITAFKSFFNRRIGKFRPFWMPSFENNIRILNTGNVVSLLLCNIDSYIPYTTGRIHVAIQADGLWYIRVLSSPTPLDSTTMQLTLSSALNIPAKSISRVCYLGLYRLNTDTAEINYSSPKMAECSLNIVEIAI